MQKPTDVAGQRVGAFLIDLVIWWVFAFVLGAATDSPGVVFLLAMAFLVGYFWVLPGLTGWTVGKRLLGIRVVKDDASGTCPAGVGKNALRELVWIADGFPYFIPYLTGFILMLTNDRNQRLGDMAAGTLVVRQEWANQPLAAAMAGAGHGQLAPPPPLGGPVAPGGPIPSGGPAAEPAPAPDWYPDPRGEKRLRYWDGGRWTEHTSD